MARTTKAELFTNEGQLVRIFGSKTLFTVSPVPEIDRIKFSVVELQTGGKDFVDIYLTTEEVRQFCSEIDNGMAKKKIDADTGSYPSAYQWIRGENGCKKLVIGGGMKGIRIQAVDSSNKNNVKRKMAVIQFSDLKELSFMFKLTYGLIPIQVGSYYDKLFHAFSDNVGKRRGSSAGYNADNDEIQPEPVSEPVKEANVSDNSNPTLKTEIISTVTCGEAEYSNGYVLVPIIIKDTNEQTELVFSEKQANELKWFNKYIERATTSGVAMTVRALRKNNCYRFLEVPPKK